MDTSTLWRWLKYGSLGLLGVAVVYLAGAVSRRQAPPSALVVRGGTAALSPLDACKRNLGRIGTALERWSVDHGGHYPQSLGQLVPTYLEAVPTCPSTQTDTYSALYAVTERPPTFSIECHADHGRSIQERAGARGK